MDQDAKQSHPRTLITVSNFLECTTDISRSEVNIGKFFCLLLTDMSRSEVNIGKVLLIVFNQAKWVD